MSLAPSMFEPERLRQTVARIKDFYKDRDDNFVTLNRWFFKEHHRTAGIPIEEDEGHIEQEAPESDIDVPSPINLPTHMINMAVSMLVQETPRIEVLVRDDERDPGKRDRKRGALAERVFMGVMQVNGTLRQRDVIYDYYHNLCLYGWGVLSVLWDETRVPESMKSDLRRAVERELEREPEDIEGPASRDAEQFGDEAPDEDEYDMPIVVEAIPPWEIYPIPGGHRERWKGVFRKWEMRLVDAEDFFGVQVQRTAEPGTPEAWAEDDAIIEVYDYWTWVGKVIWHAIVCFNLPEYGMDENGESALLGYTRYFAFKDPTAMPEYRRLPYDVRFCIPTTDSHGKNFGLSLLYTVLDAVKEAELAANRLGMIIDSTAEPQLLRYKDTAKDDNATFPAVKRGPGQTIDLDVGQGQDAKYLQGPVLPPELKDVLQLWLQFAKEWGFDPAIEGTTGLDTIVKKSGILAKLVIPIRQIEEGLAAVYSRIVRLFVERVRDKSLTVRGSRTVDGSTHAFALDVSGSELKGLHFAKFRVRARFPYDELQNSAAAQQAVTAQLMSRYKAMSEYMFLDDPDQELDRIEDEGIRFDPKWSGMTDISLEKIKLAEMTQAQSQLNPMQAGMPGPNAQLDPNGFAGQDLLQSLQQGGNPQEAMDLMGSPMQITGNVPGQPSPNGSMDDLLRQQNPGRPSG